MIDKSKVEKILHEVERQRFIAESEPYQRYINQGKNPALTIQYKAYTTLIREIVNQFQYYQATKDENIEDMVVNARVLYDIIEVIEKL